MNAPAERVLIGLGSNQGDRMAHLLFAVGRIAEHPGIDGVEASPVYRTDPWGGPIGQRDFFNAAVAAECRGIEPETLLGFLLDIERRRGRIRSVPNGPRTLDCDILLFGERIVSREGLCIPHRAMAKRNFVLVPAADIAPTMRHPGLARTVEQLRDACPSLVGLQRIEESGWHHAVRDANSF